MIVLDSRSILVSWLKIRRMVSSPSRCLNWVKSPWLGVCFLNPHALASFLSCLRRSASLLSLIMLRRCFASWALSIDNGSVGCMSGPVWW
jgi:hypothetical protein